MKTLFFLIILLYMSVSASAQSKPKFKDFIKEPALITKATGTAIDFGSSFRLDGVHFKEANRLFARKDGSFAWERSALYSIGLTWLEWEAYRRGHKKLALFVMFAEGGVRGYLGGRNLTLRKRF